jgi:hypothetical protein
MAASSCYSAAGKDMHHNVRCETCRNNELTHIVHQKYFSVVP